MEKANIYIENVRIDAKKQRPIMIEGDYRRMINHGLINLNLDLFNVLNVLFTFSKRIGLLIEKSVKEI